MQIYNNYVETSLFLVWLFFLFWGNSPLLGDTFLNRLRVEGIGGSLLWFLLLLGSRFLVLCTLSCYFLSIFVSVFSSIRFVVVVVFLAIAFLFLRPCSCFEPLDWSGIGLILTTVKQLLSGGIGNIIHSKSL